ncbi:pyridoxamine 5'-phosphate oxidase family protein [Corynebacterium variabile]|uniref:pyridoxamine 5'-phosphate oxidase family protein n=1 Tax=Corynebacterium variabile TaxID=1727 RepID=UPI0028AEB300|nr:pyridoxamine 5'-phosphate oxidase family protein [Corynebacterium variabile]
MSTEKELTQEQVLELMRGKRFVMLSTATREGKIVSHPMTPQQVEDDATVWFFIGRSSDQARAIVANPQVNLSFAEAGSWLSVSGTAEFLHDPDKIDELWSDSVETFFEAGKSDPDLTLLRVGGESAQYWGVPGGKVAATVRALAAKVRGDDKRPGMSGTTEL